jgi:hypothetical protein
MIKRCVNRVVSMEEYIRFNGDRMIKTEKPDTGDYEF